MKKPQSLIPTIGVLFALALLYFEGGVWRIIFLITIGLGLFAGLAQWLFSRAEPKSDQGPANKLGDQS